jgi:pyrroloquinoline quinone biosynthesis protein B
MLGFEALHTSSMPLWTSARMGQLLRDNAPWDQLVRLHNVELQTATPERAIELAPTVRATPVLVPHRDEYTDTLGFVLEGPRRKLLYVPDSAPWSAWSPALPDFLRARDIDVALLDGTFYSGDELPGRDLSTLAHPLMVDTMQLLQPLVDAGEVRVWFTHLNHSNPALDPEGPARAEILRRGFAVADDGLELPM